MMANNLQQSLRELRSHRKLPEREGEYWSDEEREDLSRKFNEGAGISEIAVALHRSEPAIMQQIEKLDLFDRKENPRRQRARKTVELLYVAAVEMIRHCAHFGNSAQQKRRTENV